MRAVTRDFGASMLVKEGIRANLLNGLSTGTSVDMYGCRDAYAIISFTLGSDTFDSCTILDSEDDSTFATHTTVTATLLDESGLTKVELDDIKRYVRVDVTETGSSNDSYVCVILIGKDPIYSPATSDYSSDASE